IGRLKRDKTPRLAPMLGMKGAYDASKLKSLSECRTVMLRAKGCPRGGSPSIIEPGFCFRLQLAASSSADLDRNDDPGRSRPRRETMRHWITSFRLLAILPI